MRSRRTSRRSSAIPYKPILDAGVKFYAALGNHDDAALQRNYKPFNMNGERFYSFKPQTGVRFFALDSNYVDKAQLDWLDKQLVASGSEWKIMFFHHPLYSSGETHGSAELQRGLLEPVFIKHGVNVVLTGHEHFYERIKPQKGIAYFIIGSSAKLRKGDLAEDRSHRVRKRLGLRVHADGNRRGRAVLPDHQSEGRDDRHRQHQACRQGGADVEKQSQPVVPQAKPSPAQPGPRQSK